MLSDEIFGDEAYEFTWVGKRAAIAEAGRPLAVCPQAPLAKELSANNIVTD